MMGLSTRFLRIPRPEVCWCFFSLRQPAPSLTDYYPGDGVFATTDLPLRYEPADRRFADYSLAIAQQN